MRSLDDGDDGTPIEGVAVQPGLPVAGTFVAGEIDVPAPPPSRDRTSEAAVEIRGSSLFGSDGGADPDSGSRTPPIERR